MREDADLIVGLKSGSEEAYRQLFDDYYHLLCGLATEWVDDTFIAETLVSDLFFKIWKQRDTLEIEVSLRSYLIRSVRNACINYLKSGVVRREMTLSQLGEHHSVHLLASDPNLYPHATLIQKELEAQLVAAIHQLPKETQRVFYLCRMEGKSYAEAAASLRISINTVKYHLKNAVKILTERFADNL